jgi:integrase
LVAVRLNEEIVKGLPVPARGNRVHFFSGAVLQGVPIPRGFGVRVTAGGAKSFVLDYRVKARQYRVTVGRWPTWTALRAVKVARELRQRIDRGEDHPLVPQAPERVEEAGQTLADVIASYLSRYVEPKLRPRTIAEHKRALERQIAPEIGSVPVLELKRSQIVRVLDRISDHHGPVQADRALAYLSACLNWFANRTDDYTPPLTRRMRRTTPAERARSRSLGDDEIRIVWGSLTSIYGTAVKVLLLTAQRRGDVFGMRWSEICGDVWTIPAERYKTKRDQVVPLSATVLKLIPPKGRFDHVFATRQDVPLTNTSKPKRELDSRAVIAPWRLHDLRRTGRSLMSRAGIFSDVAERVLGHAPPGIVATYDRHSYLDEKRHALEALAALLDRIINAPRDVVAVERGAQS